MTSLQEEMHSLREQLATLKQSLVEESEALEKLSPKFRDIRRADENYQQKKHRSRHSPIQSTCGHYSHHSSRTPMATEPHTRHHSYSKRHQSHASHHDIKPSPMRQEQQRHSTHHHVLTSPRSNISETQTPNTQNRGNTKTSKSYLHSINSTPKHNDKSPIKYQFKETSLIKSGSPRIGKYDQSRLQKQKQLTPTKNKKNEIIRRNIPGLHSDNDEYEVVRRAQRNLETLINYQNEIHKAKPKKTQLPKKIIVDENQADFRVSSRFPKDIKTINLSDSDFSSEDQIPNYEDVEISPYQSSDEELDKIPDEILLGITNKVSISTQAGDVLSPEKQITKLGTESEIDLESVKSAEPSHADFAAQSDNGVVGFDSEPAYNTEATMVTEDAPEFGHVSPARTYYVPQQLAETETAENASGEGETNAGRQIIEEEDSYEEEEALPLVTVMAECDEKRKNSIPSPMKEEEEEESEPTQISDKIDNTSEKIEEHSGDTKHEDLSSAEEMLSQKSLEEDKSVEGNKSPMKEIDSLNQLQDEMQAQIAAAEEMLRQTHVENNIDSLDGGIDSNQDVINDGEEEEIDIGSVRRQLKEIMSSDGDLPEIGEADVNEKSPVEDTEEHRITQSDFASQEDEVISKDANPVESPLAHDEEIEMHITEQDMAAAENAGDGLVVAITESDFI